MKKRIGAGSKKLDLVKIVDKGSISNNEEAIKQLGYKDKSAFYTLKHRLTDDIIQLKLELGKNKVIETREQIDNLRTLLYSKSSTLLIKSLHMLEKRAKELDLYKSLEEVYMCYKLVYYYNQKKQQHYSEKYSEAREKASDFARLEELFFDVCFRSPDLFYSFHEEENQKVENMLREMEVIHFKLDSPVSQFLTLSSKLSIRLNPFNDQDLSVYGEDLNKLYKLYINTPLQFRYPDCRFAIYALFNKFYYLTGDSKKFDESLLQLKSYVQTIKGYRMYENAYFYYLFINTKNLLNRRLYTSASNFLKEHIDDQLLPISSRKLVCFYHFLLALSDLYENRLESAQSNNLLSRNYSSYLEKNDYWIPIECAALSVIIQVIENNYERLSYETNRFRKMLRKHGLNNDPYWIQFSEWLNLNRKGEYAKAFAMVEDLENFSNETFNLFLVPFSHIQINYLNAEKPTYS